MQQETNSKALMHVAEQMVLAASTAPKGRGEDNLEIAILEREDVLKAAEEMERIGQEHGADAFSRDAGTLREHVSVAVVIGTHLKQLGLKYCGLCGYKDCDANRAANGICVFNPGDLGIAVGSAVAVAARLHADNRVMYTLGMAARSLKWLGEDVQIVYGIPLTGTGKNPFFDRK